MEDIPVNPTQLVKDNFTECYKLTSSLARRHFLQHQTEDQVLGLIADILLRLNRPKVIKSFQKAIAKGIRWQTYWYLSGRSLLSTKAKHFKTIGRHVDSTHLDKTAVAMTGAYSLRGEQDEDILSRIDLSRFYKTLDKKESAFVTCKVTGYEGCFCTYVKYRIARKYAKFSLYKPQRGSIAPRIV